MAEGLISRHMADHHGIDGDFIACYAGQEPSDSRRGTIADEADNDDQRMVFYRRPSNQRLGKRFVERRVVGN